MKQDLFDLTGQIGVVIGATGVLGGAISQALAGAGASVAVLGRNAERFVHMSICPVMPWIR